jgi:hypothetical protein
LWIDKRDFIVGLPKGVAVSGEAVYEETCAMPSYPFIRLNRSDIIRQNKQQDVTFGWRLCVRISQYINMARDKLS